MRLTLPYEVFPGENLEARASTEALLIYDDTFFYAGFRVRDPDPGRIRARFTDRDTAFQDDFVGVALDTFNDGRRAFEFFVNPLGVQMDLVVDDVSGNEDPSWDAIWNSAGRLTEDGYTVEIAIPYTSLRFQRIRSDQTWGLDLVRVYPRDRRFLFALNRRDRNVNCYVCQLSKIVGFEGAEPGRNLEITPTLTMIRTDSRTVESGSPVPPLQRGDPDSDLGLTARWGLSPNLTLSGAVNPDFSQVEADVAQLDVNEQFALFFPEKRPFFLEGSDFFDTPLRVVYTRTVIDPAWGLKLSGKEGRNALGFFVAQDEVTNLLFPGSQGSSATLLQQEASGAVFRYRRDFGRSSTVGALLTGRRGEDYRNAILGVDALLRPRDTDTIRLQLLASETRYPDPLAVDFEQPQGKFSDLAFDGSYFHGERDWSVYLLYRDLGQNFRSDLGFIPQVDIRRPEVGYERRFWGDPDDWYSRIAFGGNYDQTEDREGRLIEREIEAWGQLLGPLQSFLSVGGGHRLRGFRDALLDQGFVNVFFEMQPTKEVRFGLEGGWSKKIDFAFVDPTDPGAARQGDETRLAPFLRLEPGRHLRINLSHEARQLHRDEGRLFRAELSELRMTYQMSLRAFLRAIVQYTHVERGVSLYPECATSGSPPGPVPSCDLLPESRDLFAQLLFSYKINPLTAIFVGYTDSRAAFQEIGLEEVPLTRTDRTFFFKIGRAWVF
ncbi:MAG: carbohydrate binding family 9 domain-containing protein [Acidobacteria bacterium]|nr:carbohydrate binding family 9 domain-containing protein [Acidobacteriota bacterium]